MVQVALLRAVNLGAHNKVAMADLLDLLARLGFEAPRSLLQSGNLVFRAARPAGAGLERLLEAEAEKSLRLRTDFFVRTAKEWNAVVAGNPFLDEAALVERKLDSRGTGRNWNTVLKLEGLTGSDRRRAQRPRRSKRPYLPPAGGPA